MVSARSGAHVVSFLLCALVVLASHLWLVGLPYYWDETGQFIPAALDILHRGSWIPRSTLPNIHPPAVMAYLAAAWSVAGYHPATTRCAMLLLASIAAFAAFLLAIQLSRDVPGKPALLAAGLLCVSPLFFAQAMLAQLDAPAMLFTTLALLFFLQERIALSAAVCVVLVLVKETGVVVPIMCALWLVHERRWRDGAVYAAPVVALAAWIAILWWHTGSWTGNPEFAHYNLYYPLHPARIVVTLLRRLYFVLIGNFHWVGVAAVVVACRRNPAFRSGVLGSRGWRVAGLLVAAHVAMFTVLGGAVLARYLLPILPIVYAAMAAGFSALGRVPRLVGAAAMLAGLAAGNFLNPIYPFPFEENLAFTDFVRLQAEAADYLEARYPDACVDTVWPMTAELAYPEFGFVQRGMTVRLLPNLSPKALESIDWSHVQVLVAYPRNSAPPFGLASKLPRRFYAEGSDATREEVRARAPFAPAAGFERHGQWIDVYVNPAWAKERLPQRP